MKVLSYFILLSCTLLSVATAQLSGPLNGSISSGEYDVVGDISVPQGDSLFIEPGVTFLFTGLYEFSIYGYLNATGTIEDSIKFVPYRSGGWHGLNFYPSANDFCILEYCYILKSLSSGIHCESTDIILRHCGIWKNSANTDGAGIYFNYSNSIIEDCRISLNTFFETYPHYKGAGIYWGNSVTSIHNSNINGNSTNGVGGGVFFDYCDGQIVNSVFQGNVGERGGGVYTYHSSMDVISTSITFNTAYSTSGSIFYGSGGGMICTGGSSIYIDQCDISSNCGNGRGGGILFDWENPGAPDFVITNSRICDNWLWHIASQGGGISVGYPTSYEISNCLISGNSCSAQGGGVRTVACDGSIINCTIANNDVDWWTGEGGGVYLSGGDIDLRNTIIADNTGDPELYLSSEPSGTISYCDFYDSNGNWFGGAIPHGLGNVITVNANNDSCDIFYNIFESPLFYTTTGDSAYYLNVESPCIDAGDPLLPWDPDSTIADIGAFYYHQNNIAGLEFSKLERPGNFVLHQNYPNPFNPATTLRFRLTEASTVNLRVYDVMGREVASLVNGYRNAGPHEVTFDASHLASGIYLYQMEAGDFSASRKMVLMK
jgi:hypothetical protein